MLRGGAGFFAGPPAYVWFRTVYGTTGRPRAPSRMHRQRGAGLHPRPEQPAHGLLLNRRPWHSHSPTSIPIFTIRVP